MFLINYEILEEEKKRISNLNNIVEFESDVNTVMGQIELIFNNTKEGFVDKDIPFSGEFLITWFKRLNDALSQLKASSFVTIKIPDSDRIWFEFKLVNEEVLISKVRAEKEIHIEKFILNLPKSRSEIFWCESISKDELYNTILCTTNNFMKDIWAINQLIVESKEFKELKDKYIKAKNY
ncbi:hypothetical protein NNC19_13150 [Clostridium sp. SHJSY1]|uniref:hypothetical protein n=1 Tax=Clostridium sp. SHJSY1 TaxID=2942483 RepID=UPI0028757497|nr:hypothetical protein [Clostridium sp. SHJSY1]MDS0526632.1 hypothetical protein [Clostridium sp. SHJSY1]